MKIQIEAFLLVKSFGRVSLVGVRTSFFVGEGPSSEILLFKLQLQYAIALCFVVRVRGDLCEVKFVLLHVCACLLYILHVCDILRVFAHSAQTPDRLTSRHSTYSW